MSKQVPEGYDASVDLLEFLNEHYPTYTSVRWTADEAGTFWLYVYHNKPVHTCTPVQLAKGIWLDTDSFMAEKVFERLTGHGKKIT